MVTLRPDIRLKGFISSMRPQPEKTDGKIILRIRINKFYPDWIPDEELHNWFRKHVLFDEIGEAARYAEKTGGQLYSVVGRASERDLEIGYVAKDLEDVPTAFWCVVNATKQELEAHGRIPKPQYKIVQHEVN